MDNDRPAQVHIDKSHGGTDDMDNLRVLCSLCNEGAKKLMQEARQSWLARHPEARSEQRRI
ncbi:MAG: HNH endonuclease [Rhodospirillales bacterium]